MRSVKKYYTGFCDSDQSKMAIVRDAGCGRTPLAKAQIERKINEITNGMIYVNSLSLDDQIPSICCLYTTMNPRILTAVDRVCTAAGITDSNDHFFRRMFPAVFADVSDLICGDRYSNVAGCEANFGQSQGLNAALDAENLSFNHTFLIPLLNFVKRLD